MCLVSPRRVDEGKVRCSLRGYDASELLRRYVRWLMLHVIANRFPLPLLHHDELLMMDIVDVVLLALLRVLVLLLLLLLVLLVVVVIVFTLDDFLDAHARVLLLTLRERFDFQRVASLLVVVHSTLVLPILPSTCRSSASSERLSDVRRAEVWVQSHVVFVVSHHLVIGRLVEVSRRASSVLCVLFRHRAHGTRRTSRKILQGSNALVVHFFLRLLEADLRYVAQPVESVPRRRRYGCEPILRIWRRHEEVVRRACSERDPPV
mmetsp:Transcript_14959/g.37643  ORF Transcript_14959/g.37643 Transcript_14959/m.37643 type:complete len:263 (+) Transcript_14959:467-1255(+)